jgi:pimeloyl-ACP methyl ester carboxylesterase
MISGKTHGSGPRTFVAYHGWGGGASTFNPLVPFLPADCSLICPDLPGYGSSPVPERWTAADLAKRCASEIVDAGLQPFTFIGNCSGAIIALLTARLLPQGSITRFVLIDPFASMPRYFALFLNPVFGERAYRATFATAAGRWITNSALRSRRTKRSDLTASFSQINHQVVYNYLRILGSFSSADEFRGADQPVDLVHGQRTFRAVRDSMAIWQKVFPQARVTVLPGAGHLPIEESPEALAMFAFRGRHE